MTHTDQQYFMAEALREARQGLEGGIPIGSVLAIDGEIVGRGQNRRVQRGSAVLHAEMDCLGMRSPKSGAVPAGGALLDTVAL